MDRSTLFSIGEFAQAAGISTKALRYYEKKGILKPYWIEQDTGYRYYSLYQLNQLNLIGIFIDLDICLNQFSNYIDYNYSSIDYQKLLQFGKELTQERIQILEDKMRYINYLKEKAEHSFPNNLTHPQPVWLLPCNEIPDKASVEKALKKILHDISTYGLTLFQSYGLIMICNGNEKRLFYFADISHPSEKTIIHENIFYLPQGEYRSIEQNNWSIEMAPALFQDLFELNYDKVIIERELTYNNKTPLYSLSCLLPSTR